MSVTSPLPGRNSQELFAFFPLRPPARLNTGPSRRCKSANSLEQTYTAYFPQTAKNKPAFDTPRRPVACKGSSSNLLGATNRLVALSNSVGMPSRTSLVPRARRLPKLLECDEI